MVQSKVIWRALPALVSVVLVPFRLEAQTVQAGPVEFRFGGRIQMQFSTTSLDRSDIPGGGSVDPADLEIRRLRASVEARLGDRLKGKVEPDFTSRDATLRDAWVDVAFADGFALRAGQFKKPFSRLESTSSVLIVPIERGVRIRGLRSALGAATEPVTGRPLFGEAGGSPVLGDGYALLDGLGYLGRDVGLAAHGRLGRVAYEVGVFNGRGTSVRPGQEGLAAAGRLVVRPAPGLPLSIGAGASYRKSRFDDTDALRRRGGAAFEVDAEWGEFRRPGVHVVVEGAVGSNPAVDATLVGAQGIVAYFAPLAWRPIEGIEPLVRVGYGDPDTGRRGDQGWLLTPGVNVYLPGKNRLMLNWDLYVAGAGRPRSASAVRAQAQVAL